MKIEEFKKLTEEQIKEYWETIPFGTTETSKGKIVKKQNTTWYEVTYNENGDILTFFDSTGDWYKNTYRTDGQLLKTMESDGEWEEYIYNSDGVEIGFKNNDGSYFNIT